MSGWVLKGISTGIKTTAYPHRSESAAGVTPGLPVGGEFGAEAARLAQRCPVHALEEARGAVAFTATAAFAAPRGPLHGRATMNGRD